MRASCSRCLVLVLVCAQAHAPGDCASPENHCCASNNVGVQGRVRAANNWGLASAVASVGRPPGYVAAALAGLAGGGRIRKISGGGSSSSSSLLPFSARIRAARLRARGCADEPAPARPRLNALAPDASRVATRSLPAPFCPPARQSEQESGPSGGLIRAGLLLFSQPVSLAEINRLTSSSPSDCTFCLPRAHLELSICEPHRYHDGWKPECKHG